ncbi:hypothetical protein SDC9_109973 [bioreactor metagenome]|uniref:Uncharacterized protein n=1 Tax=bioreactor metagenome TaxID=1076179 RepID=A0A645BIR8_9ZZZZ
MKKQFFRQMQMNYIFCTNLTGTVQKELTPYAVRLTFSRWVRELNS